MCFSTAETPNKMFPQEEDKEVEEEKEEKEEEEADIIIHGDVLEAVISHVPLIDLAPACQVSNEWNRAVFSSLRNFKRIKPWLMVHTQRPRPTYVTISHAYDPRSHVWVEIRKPPVQYGSALRSSHSTVLYTATPANLSLSFDRLNVNWRVLAGQHVWRTDPTVAIVGSRVVVAGGTCNFEDDALAVETYDLKTRTWYTCKSSMPSILKDCAAATWLSVAANDHKMFVTEKASGMTYSFDPSSENWQGPYGYDLRADNPCMFFSTIGLANNRLILVGLIGDAKDVKSVKMWEAISSGGESLEHFREIGEMPKVLVKKLVMRDDDDDCQMLDSIGLTCAGDFVYIYNPSDPNEIVICELGGDGGGSGGCAVCQWGSVRNVVMNDTTRMENFLFTSSMVEIQDIERAVREGNWKFSVKSN